MKHNTMASILLHARLVVMASDVTTDSMAEARNWKSSVLLELTRKNSSSSEGSLKCTQMISSTRYSQSSV